MHLKPVLAQDFVIKKAASFPKPLFSKINDKKTSA